MNKFDYVIVGGGLAGASAIQGIRKHDSNVGWVTAQKTALNPTYTSAAYVS